jgi:hypothetical protein
MKDLLKKPLKQVKYPSDEGIYMEVINEINHTLYEVTHSRVKSKKLGINS